MLEKHLTLDYDFNCNEGFIFTSILIRVTSFNLNYKISIVFAEEEIILFKNLLGSKQQIRKHFVLSEYKMKKRIKNI